MIATTLGNGKRFGSQGDFPVASSATGKPLIQLDEVRNRSAGIEDRVRAPRFILEL
jgi:hypothetical protein